MITSSQYIENTHLHHYSLVEREKWLQFKRWSAICYDEKCIALISMQSPCKLPPTLNSTEHLMSLNKVVVGNSSILCACWTYCMPKIENKRYTRNKCSSLLSVFYSKHWWVVLLCVFPSSTCLIFLTIKYFISRFQDQFFHNSRNRCLERMWKIERITPRFYYACVFYNTTTDTR